MIYLARVRRFCVGHWPYLTVAAVFVLSRLVYRFALKLEFDHSPVEYFIQYLSPWFVEHDFWRSLLYLHQQALLQNLLTGGSIRLLGSSTAFVFLDRLYLTCGLTTLLATLCAMLRLGASRVVAVLAVSLYAAHPVTVLYEMWLFYHTPVATLLMLSLLALLRYYRTGTFRAAFTFFALFAAVALFYALYGPALLVAVALGLLLRPPRASPRSRMLWALAIPLGVLVLNLQKTQLLVGHRHGEAFLWENLAVKTANELEPEERRLLVRRGLISRAVNIQLFSSPLSVFGDLRVAHPPTGIPLLDLEQTPDGAPNAHALGHVLIAENYFKPAAEYLLLHHPDAFGRGFFRALTRDYFRSAMDHDDTLYSADREKLRPVVDRVDSLLWRNHERALLLLVVVMPITLLYALYRVLGPRAWLESERSAVAAISYMLLLIAYVTVAVTVIAVGDFCRYRFNVDPFYLILFVLLVTDLGHRLAAWHRRLRTRLTTHAALPP
jgi:hypothetical protein